MQVGDSPLFSVSRLSFVDSLIRLCGGRNVFADAAVPAPQVSVEAVLAGDDAQAERLMSAHVTLRVEQVRDLVAVWNARRQAPPSPAQPARKTKR